MTELVDLIDISAERKPTMGDPCNHCGWCCLTQICPMGKELTGRTDGRCPLLITEGTNHLCKLGTTGIPDLIEIMGFGDGCCAKTQKEQIEELKEAGHVVIE